MRGQVAVIAVTVGLVLAGCTADADRVDPTTAEPAAPATVTAAPSPSSTPSPTVDVTVPPERPESMATPSADGAAAAASYFISLYPYVYATGDLAEWRALADPACEFCNAVAQEVEDLHSRERRVTSPLEVLSSTGIEIDPSHWYSAEVAIRLDDSQEIDDSGAVLSSEPGGSYTTTFALTWADGWRVDAVGLEPSAS